MKTEALKEFVESSITPTFCLNNICDKLEEQGFFEVLEEENFEGPYSKADSKKGIFVIRGNGVVAVKFPKATENHLFKCVLTHLDSPCLKIRGNKGIKAEGCYKLSVEKYGSPILYSWLDKPLGVAGTIQYFDSDGEYQSLTIGLKQCVIIPSQAFHINREVNNKNELKLAKDMMPIFSIEECNLDNVINGIIEEMKEEYDLDITDATDITYDLQLYNPEPVQIYELMGDATPLITGPRLDNLVSVYSALEAFLSAEDDEQDGAFKVFAAFDGEEVGSQVLGGADTNFLTNVLERVADMFMRNPKHIFPCSICLSVDAAHAIHPNAPEKFDKNNCVKLGEGIVIKHHVNYAQDIAFETWLKRACNVSATNIQDYYHNPDMPCGATLGKIAMSQHGIPTIDIGVPMHAMHSASETIALTDCVDLTEILQMFYEY